MIKKDFPNPAKWIYKKWYFWVIVFLYSILSELKSYLNISIAEIIGSLIASFLITSFVFIFIYLIAKHNYKKLKHI